MKPMKVYISSAAFLRAAEALGDERHQQQATLYVVAASKADAARVLIETGMREHVAQGHVRESRVMAAPYSTDLRACVEVGIIDVTVRGAYAFSMNHGPHVVRLTSEGPVRIAVRSIDEKTRQRVYAPAPEHEPEATR